MAQKFKIKRVTGFVYILISCFLLYAVFSSVKSVMKNKQNLNQLQQQAAKLKAERDELQTEIEKLNDEDYVTRYARENYVFTREGERVAIIPGDE